MTLTFWHWLVLGGLLLLLEVLTPGFVFIWLALAAGGDRHPALAGAAARLAAPGADLRGRGRCQRRRLVLVVAASRRRWTVRLA